MKRLALLVFSLPFGLIACGSSEQALEEVPLLDAYCLAAQNVVTNTDIDVQLTIHEDFEAFVKSKALIEGPTIQQYHWEDATGRVAGVSCKLKSADHLNLTFGEGSAGPDESCQAMNQAVFMLLAPTVKEPVFSKVVFDPDESLPSLDGAPGMSGPAWLAPYQATGVGDDGALVIRTKGFVVDFADERYAKAPPRFRGVHYCHFVAPDYLQALLEGSAEPGLMIGRSPALNGRGF